MSKKPEIISNEVISRIEAELGKIKDAEKRRRVTRFIIAALSSIPWIGESDGIGSSAKIK